MPLVARDQPNGFRLTPHAARKPVHPFSRHPCRAAGTAAVSKHARGNCYSIGSSIYPPRVSSPPFSDHCLIRLSRFLAPLNNDSDAFSRQPGSGSFYLRKRSLVEENVLKKFFGTLAEQYVETIILWSFGYYLISEVV